MVRRPGRGGTLAGDACRLVLYEGWPLPDPEVVTAPPGVMESMAAQLDTGDDEAALETFYREVGRGQSTGMWIGMV